MKKLFFIALFCIGCLTISNAQFFQWEVTNASNTNWYWAMYDAGPSATQYELNILPGQTRVGAIGNFAFPVTWKAGTYSSPNCYVTNTDGGPIIATTLPTACPGVTVTYKIVEIVPGFFYIYKIILG